MRLQPRQYSRLSAHPDSPTDLTMEDVLPVNYGETSATAVRNFLGVTGPFFNGDPYGFQGKAYNFAFGVINCTSLAEDPSKWIGHLYDNPERAVLQADDTHFSRDSRLNPVSFRQAFVIHQTLDYFLNDSSSIDLQTRAHLPLDTILACIQKQIDNLLKPIPESVALIRLDLPIFDPLSQALSQDLRTVNEQVTVEYYRSPWSLQWNRRVRAAPVEKNSTWYLSLPVGSNARFEYDEPPVRCLNDQLADFSGDEFPELTADSGEDHIIDSDAGMDVSSLFSTSLVDFVPSFTPIVPTSHAHHHSDVSIASDYAALAQTVASHPLLDPGISIYPFSSFDSETGVDFLGNIPEYGHDSQLCPIIPTTNTLSLPSLPHTSGPTAPKTTPPSSTCRYDTQTIQTVELCLPATTCAALEQHSLSMALNHPMNDSSLSPEIANNDDYDDSASSAISNIEVDEPPIPNINAHQPPTNHMLAGTNPDHVQNFRCPYWVCIHRPFTTQWSLDRHVDTHDGVKHPCDLCNKTYSRAHDLRRHVKRIHNEELWRCEYCQNTFARKSTPGKPHRCSGGTGKPPLYVLVGADGLPFAKP